MRLLHKRKSLKDSYVTEKPSTAWVFTKESWICGAPCMTCRQLRTLDNLFSTAMTALYDLREELYESCKLQELSETLECFLKLASFIYFLSLPSGTPSRMECFSPEQIWCTSSCKDSRWFVHGLSSLLILQRNVTVVTRRLSTNGKHHCWCFQTSARVPRL